RAGDVNLYRFVENNPTNFTDPSGLDPPPGRPQLQRPPTPYMQLSIIYERPGKKPQNTYPGYMMMNGLGFSKYESIWIWDRDETQEYMQLKKGCIGLNAIRLGLLDGKTAQCALPGLRCFTSLTDALTAQAGHTDKDKYSILFAVQSTKELKDFKEFLKPGSNTEYDPKAICPTNLGGYNYATAIQDTNGDVEYWEHMAFGISGNPDLTAIHSLELPKYPTNFYCVVEVPKHKYAPPVLSDQLSGK
ncbi:MAG: hypothetical protein MN733_35915, partial [Nitrososphaera sp.]|nr:hypothetical protein [Nitrososphaera sp.]